MRHASHHPSRNAIISYEPNSGTLNRRLTCRERGRQRSVSLASKHTVSSRHLSPQGRGWNLQGRWSSLSATENTSSAASSVAVTLESALDFVVDLRQSATPGYVPMRRREDNLRTIRMQQTAAVQAAQGLKALVQNVVDSKQPGLKGLQASILAGGAVAALVPLARKGEPIAYETLQILCYRNAVVCEQMVSDGILDLILRELPSARTSLQSSMCHLLTALVAFSSATHNAVAESGLVPQMVSICRSVGGKTGTREDDTKEMFTKLESRAAAVLRNLAHDDLQHQLLMQSGAVDVLADIMKKSQDPASCINAAVAVACLVGNEENNARLHLDEELVGSMLEVLDAACQGVQCHGHFWTVWKLCQGLSKLTVTEQNKALVVGNGGIRLLAEVLFGKHHNNEAAQRYALSALWNLAFDNNARQVILKTPGLVEAIKDALVTAENPKTREVAKGVLWTLGVTPHGPQAQAKAASTLMVDKVVEQLEHQIQEHKAGIDINYSASVLPTASSTSLMATGSSLDADDAAVGGEGRENAEEPPAEQQHIMLSYEWNSQKHVLLIKSELEKAGYKTWMDVDQMSGSTLEAMAKAVEGSCVLLMCVSKKYKESQACRTEAEYAFQQRKRIVPIIMEGSYKATGWLGALMGTRLYFDMSDAARIPSKMPSLVKELGASGRVIPPNASEDEGAFRRGSNGYVVVRSAAESWSYSEVEDWLRRINCGDHAATFRSKCVDGMALSGMLRMTSDPRFIHEMLENEFGVKHAGLRLRLVEELHRLFS